MRVKVIVPASPVAANAVAGNRDKTVTAAMTIAGVMQNLISRKDAAEILGISVKTLDQATEPSITGQESLTQTASKLISTVKHVKRSMIKHKLPPEL